MSEADDVSDTQEQIDDLKAGLDEAARLERMRKETSNIDTLIKHRKAKTALENMEQSDKDLAAASKANFSKMSDEAVIKLKKDNAEYINAAKNMLCFISAETFGSLVPFFRKNLIFIGADTGDGKSTCVANIAFSVISMKNAQGENAFKRICIATNEERAEDVLNRITCLGMGWPYTNHNEFTDFQAQQFDKGIGALTANGRVTVVDDTFGDSHGVTSTLEGMEMFFARLYAEYEATGEHYDAILIDYYQNVIASSKDSSLTENQVQERFSRLLDKYKNIYPAPIVLMGQMNKADKENSKPWKQRIAGRKIIADKCTCVIEMTADKEKMTTVWTVWKSRFTKAVGKKLTTGYDNGLFVEDSDEFRVKVQKMRDAEESRAFDKKIKIKKDPKDGTDNKSD